MSDAHNGGAGSPARAAPGVAFAGMSKEELMQFANDPFWVRIRWALFILFWLIWFGMIAGAVLVIITGAFFPLPFFSPSPSWLSLMNCKKYVFALLLSAEMPCEA